MRTHAREPSLTASMAARPRTAIAIMLSLSCTEVSSSWEPPTVMAGGGHAPQRKRLVRCSAAAIRAVEQALSTRTFK